MIAQPGDGLLVQLIFMNRRHIVVRAEPGYQSDEMQHPEHSAAYTFNEMDGQSAQYLLVQLDKQHG